jgi:hypothetical protein
LGTRNLCKWITISDCLLSRLWPSPSALAPLPARRRPLPSPVVLLPDRRRPLLPSAAGISLPGPPPAAPSSRSAAGSSFTGHRRTQQIRGHPVPSRLPHQHRRNASRFSIVCACALDFDDQSIPSKKSLHLWARCPALLVR